MNKIHLIPPNIVAKIAAGEVIERPAFAIKELIENAIDAHADSITITIENAGLKKIIVSDTGEGMNKNDLIESIKPHTTSKISEDAESLTGISTLGFRGEALASIAAVSNLTIKSRTADAATGNIITPLSAVIPAGMPIGTVVTVEQLFHSLPARKRFLKSPKTEFRHILETVIPYAINSPKIAFRLIHNKKTVIDVPKSQTHTDRIIALLGKQVNENLLPVTYKDSYVRIQGFIGNPHMSVKTAAKQFFYINGRYVVDTQLSQALKNAYGNLLDLHSFPIGIVFIRLPYEFVDVNVHPRKTYVTFTNASLVIHGLDKSATSILSSYTLSFSRIKTITSSYAGKLVRSGPLPGKSFDIRESRILQIHGTYLVLETNEGMILIDQHAAHERILYEHFKSRFLHQASMRKQYRLKKAYEFELSLPDALILEEYLSTINAMGFSISKTGKTIFSLSSVPILFQDRNYLELLLELCDTFREGQKTKNIDVLSQKILSYLACRSAIKAGDKLTAPQAKELLETLGKTPHNTTCAHGRPIYQNITLRKLHAMFKRR